MLALKNGLRTCYLFGCWSNGEGGFKYTFGSNGRCGTGALRVVGAGRIVFGSASLGTGSTIAEQIFLVESFQLCVLEASRRHCWRNSGVHRR